MKQKGAIPIPYIVALIFGVIIIVLLSYWFTSQGGKTISIGSQTDCESRKYTFCSQWDANRYTFTPPSLGFGEACEKPTTPEECWQIVGLNCNKYSTNSCADYRPRIVDHGKHPDVDNRICCTT